MLKSFLLPFLILISAFPGFSWLWENFSLLDETQESFYVPPKEIVPFSFAKRDTTPDLIATLPDTNILKDSTLGDTTIITPMTKSDTVKTVELSEDEKFKQKLINSLNFTQDSTARIEQLTYRRQPKWTAQPTDRQESPLFLSSPRATLKLITIDSTLSKVTIRERLNDMDLFDPITMEYSDYVNLRYQQNIRNNWTSISGAGRETKRADAIEELLSKITNVDIYVPGGGGKFFETIFGPARINIKVNGSIDVKAGWATNYNSASAATTGQNTTTDPVFDQQFQMNVQGTVGDKLQINADWSTQRTFEYENSLRIVYTGYEDEIIQKIEAGNVSLSTPNRYIGGSSALFGIKGQMQLGPLMWTFLASQKKGKTEKKDISGGSQESNFRINITDYEYDKHYFISKFYRDNYESYFTNLPNPGTSGASINEFEVWKLKTTQTTSQDERDAVAFAKLGEIESNNIFTVPGGVGTFYSATLLDQIREGTLKANDMPGFSGDEIIDGRWVKLREGPDYIINDQHGTISFNIVVENTSAIAIAYRISISNTNQAVIGDFSNTVLAEEGSERRLILKLIRPKSPSYQNKYAWDNMMKNIYRLPSNGFKQDDLELNLEYENESNILQPTLPEVPEPTLLTALKMDLFGPGNSGVPDGKFDFLDFITIRPSRGELIFPYLRPFDTGIAPLVNSLEAEKRNRYIFKELYDTTQSGAKNKYINKSKYYLTGKVKGGVTDKYSLGFNITEGSIKVSANNITLIAGQDYIVDYQMGMIQIKNQAYLTPGSNLSIEYETNDLFSFESKTFIGSRFDLDISENAKLGFTWMRYAEKPLSDKVRIGEEPMVNNIIGFDGSWKMNSRNITKALNYLPGIKTDAPSEFSVKGEYAHFFPGHPSELNTDLDPRGVSFIDDFEGSRRSITLGLGYNSWALSSAPVNINAVLDSTKSDSIKTNYRALLRFFNDYVGRVPVTEIWPERSVSSRDNLLTTFSMEYFPKKRGPFNYSTRLGETIYNSNGETWAGIQKAMPTYISNLVNENIDYIEFWFQVSDNRFNPGVFTDSEGGFLTIDLGFISEDIIPNKKLNSELGVSQETATTDNWGKYPLTGITLSSFVTLDDVGLDGLNDDQERLKFAAFISALENDAAIPEEEKLRILLDISGDNYTYLEQSYDYSGVNGSQGNTSNRTSIDRTYPDIEDMNSNGALDQVNEYFSYRIPISLDSLSTQAKFIVTENDQSKWYQARIPLTEWVKKTGNIRDLSFVEFVRLSMTGFKNDVHIQFATFDFVGNQWLKTENDSVLSVSVINVEENPLQYNSPPGVNRQKDRTRPDENIQLNEQALALNITELKDNEERSIRRNFSTQSGLNIGNYETLKMFVHGPENQPGETLIEYIDPDNYDAEVFIRFGNDNNNYYEIAQPLHPDLPKTVGQLATWDIRNQFTVDLLRLTALKTEKIRPNDTVIVRNPQGYPAGTTITLRGSPSINNIKLFTIGVKNPEGRGKNSPLTFRVWVNELRVSGFREDDGYAISGTMGLKLADIGNVSFTIERKTADFRRVDTKPGAGSRDSENSWGVQANFQLDKFFTDKKTFQLPISFSHTERISEPKFLTGSDILLKKAAEQAGENGDLLIDINKTINVSNVVTFNDVKKLVPSDNPFLQYTIDKMKLSYSYNNSYSRSPSLAWSHSWSWKSDIDYSYSFQPDLFVQPFDWPLYVFTLDFLWINQIFDQTFIKDWRDTKIYLKPQTFASSVSFNRSRSQSQQRNTDKVGALSADFNSSRTMSMNWRFTDNLSMTFSNSFKSSYFNLLFDQYNLERSESEVFRDWMRNLTMLNFGENRGYSQNISFNYKVPIFKPLNISSSYSSQYQWSNGTQQRSGQGAGGEDQKNNFGNSAGWATSISLQSNFRIKDLFAKDTKDSKAEIPKVKSTRRDTLTVSQVLLQDLESLTDIFLSLDAISFRLSQTNSFTTAGLAGESGFMNFFPFNQPWWPSALDIYGPGVSRGPSLAFQLGLTTDPGTRIFARGSTRSPVAGPGTNLTIRENFSQTNTVDFRTGFQPAERVKVDLTWKLSWAFRDDNQLNSQTLQYTSRSAGGSINRSFIALFSDFKSIEKEIPKDPNTGNFVYGNNEVFGAFRDGLEFISFSKKFKNLFTWGDAIVFPSEWQDYVPLPNWSITWSGLEKFALWESVMNSMTLSHAYTSEISTTHNIKPNAGTEITNPIPNQPKLIVPYIEFSSPKVSERFSPLVGLNMNFKGSFSTRINYNRSKNISLSTVNYQITTQTSQEISATISYASTGSTLLNFWPFDGNTLKNDIDMSLTGSYGIDDTVIEPLIRTIPANTPPTGTVRMALEPRIGYRISSRVNATAFWRYTRSEPTTGSLTVPEISRSEVGMNINITIQ